MFSSQIKEIIRVHVSQNLNLLNLSCYNNPSGDMEDTGQMQTDETLPSYHNHDKRNTKNTKQIILLVCGPFDAGDW